MKLHGFRALTLLIPLIALASQLAGAEPPTKLAEQIRSAALATAERLATDTVHWTTTLSIPGGTAKAVVEHYHQGAESELITIKLQSPNGTAQEIVRIVAKEGLWYVREPERSYVCRPYEAVLALPMSYQFLAQSDVQVLTELESLDQLGEFVSIDGDRATFRTQLPEENLNYLRAAEPALEAALDDPKVDRVGIERQLRLIREILANGITTIISLKTGTFLEMGAPDKRLVFENLRWLADPQADLFSVEDRQWDDQTRPLATTAAELEEIIAIRYCPIWRLGGPEFTDHAVLLNIRTGETRRVPFADSEFLANCFSADRSKLYGSGTISNEGRLGLFEINLVDGATRELAAGEFQGMPLAPVLSPNGSTLVCAATMTQAAAGVDPLDPSEFLKSQIYLVDVATDAARKLGTPLDTAYLSWFPDSSGLLLITREHQDRDQPSIDSLARMDLQGNVTEICPGSCPIIVQNGTRIMYEITGPNESETWLTSDLDGKNLTQVGDGLDGFAFPSPSPSGDRVTMMKFGGPKGPRPYLIEIETGKATAIPVRDGLWSRPAWK